MYFKLGQIKKIGDDGWCVWNGERWEGPFHHKFMAQICSDEFTRKNGPLDNCTGVSIQKMPQFEKYLLDCVKCKLTTIGNGEGEISQKDAEISMEICPESFEII